LHFFFERASRRAYPRPSAAGLTTPIFAWERDPEMETVVVVGASRGIGWELCKQLLARGDRVVATCRDAEGAARLTSLGSPRCQPVELDVRAPDGVAALCTALGDQAVDVVIHSAAIMPPDAPGLDELDHAAWAETFAVNVQGPYRVITALRTHLRRSPRPRALALSSIMGCLHRDSVGHYAYRSSKAALNKVLKLLSRDLPDVVVCPVHPGWVRTEMGGPDAELSVEASAAGLLALADRLTLEHTGRFWQWNGTELAW
jgi:NAD(P)-dependent dehydrogenase (short-subunit alcohol dehydrogenase family)